MRVLIGEIKHEANTFSPVATTLQSFRDYHYLVGAEIENLRGTRTELGAFLDVARQKNWQIVPALAAMAMSSGKVTRETFDALKTALLDALGAAGELDGVLLALHGAMVMQDVDDAEGDLLAAVRSAAGPRLPVVASLDLHGNITPAMVQHADILVGFDTCPHTDLYETGERAARLLSRLMGGEIRPAMALARVPLIVPPDTMDTSDGPLGEIVRRAKSLEHHAHILSASVFCVQPWLDIPDLACSTLVVSDGEASAAQDAARALAHAFWQTRHAFRVELHSPEQAIALAAQEGSGPVIFSDSADSIGSGATGDATGILRALLAAADLPGTALTTIVDPQVVEQAVSAGVGAHVALKVGGKRDTRFNTPVYLQGRVRTIFEGRFRLSGASYGGLEMNMGRTVVVESHQVFVVITSLPTWTHHPDFYRAVGLKPEDALIVVTKSNILFKASYRELARKILWVAAEGLSDPNLTRLPFARITRPLYPFDEMETFDDRTTVHFG
jgi:microcystin degradation protein MlrC